MDIGKELITVIVPVYNTSEYVATCLTSIIEQTYNNLEIIVVDDGSEDMSGAICEEFALRDKRFHVIHKKNEGLSSARNTGLDCAAGKWVTFVDSDDWIEPGTIERYCSLAEEHKCYIAACNMIRVTEGDARSPFYKPADNAVLLEGRDRFQTLVQPSVCNKLFRRELFQDIRFPEGKNYEDTFVYYKLAHRANRIILTGSDDYIYRYREDSIIGSRGYDKGHFDIVEALYQMMEYMNANGEEECAAWACLHLHTAAFDVENNITHTKENRTSFDRMRMQYRKACDFYIRYNGRTLKQCGHFLMMRYMPALYIKLRGRKRR